MSSVVGKASQLVFACQESTVETPGKGVKHIQS